MSRSSFSGDHDAVVVVLTAPDDRGGGVDPVVIDVVG